MIQLLATAIGEATMRDDLERIRRNHADAIHELQLGALARATIIKDVSLANATPTPVPHRLGRPVFAIPSPARGASSTGRIAEIRSGSYSREQFVVLQADGWGATITVDLLVVPL